MIALIPCGDRLLVLPDTAQSHTDYGFELPDSAVETIQQGTIVAAGDAAQKFRSGQRILFGKGAGTKMEVDGKPHLVLRAADVWFMVDNIPILDHIHTQISGVPGEGIILVFENQHDLSLAEQKIATGMFCTAEKDEALNGLHINVYSYRGRNYILCTEDTKPSKPNCRVVYAKDFLK